MRSLGYEIAFVTYDDPSALARFAGQRNIDFTLVSDEGSKLIKAFGVLNEQIPEGSSAYGIANPITFVVGPDKVITHRFSKQRYSNLIDPEIVLKELEGS